MQLGFACLPATKLTQTLGGIVMPRPLLGYVAPWNVKGSWLQPEQHLKQASESLNAAHFLLHDLLDISWRTSNHVACRLEVSTHSGTHLMDLLPPALVISCRMS